MGNGFGRVKKNAALLSVLLLAGCATGARWGDTHREKLLSATNGYTTLLRWREFDKACVNFVEESVRGKCLERAQTLNDLRITDIRTRDLDFRTDGVEVTATVEMEYYLLPSLVVRKIQDRQLWLCRGPDEGRVCRIITPLPAF